MKLRRSKVETTNLLSTSANVCLPKTLPSSLIFVLDEILLNSFITHFSIASSRLTLFLINFVVRIVDVRQPMTSPFAFRTGN